MVKSVSAKKTAKRKTPAKRKSPRPKGPRRNPKNPPAPIKGEAQKPRTPADIRAEATLHAADLLAMGMKASNVIRKLQGEPYYAHPSTARSVVKEVQAEWAQWDAQHVMQARARQLARIYSLYREARAAERYNVCARLEAMLARLEQTLPSLDEDPAHAAPADEFAGRSRADLEFFMANGFWPEVSPDLH